MERLSIFFLQALWDENIQPERIRNIAIKGAHKEIERLFSALLDKATLWISEDSCMRKEEIRVLLKTVNKIQRPIDLLSIMERANVLFGELQGLELRTLRALDAPASVRPDNVHIVPGPFKEYAYERIAESITVHIYRILLYGGPNYLQMLHFPEKKDIETLVEFFCKEISPILNLVEEEKRGAKWIYTKQSVVMGPLKVCQFVSRTVKQGESDIPVGMVREQSGVSGELCFFGKGMISNISPLEAYDLAITGNICFDRELPMPTTNFGRIDENPREMLERWFKGEKFLITPEAYFILINQVLLLRTVADREKAGECVFCGGLLERGHCPKCEQRS